MDTDNLSLQTFNGVIGESEMFHHDLALQFGVLASECKDDDDYLNNAEALINEWLDDKEGLEGLTSEIFFDGHVDLDTFKTTLKKILSNIAKIRKAPMSQREYEE